MMSFDDLKNPEFQEKLKGAMTPEELLAVVKEEGYELTEEELAHIAGGGGFPWNSPKNCPSCGSGNIYHYGSEFFCRDCSYHWIESGF